MELGGLAQAIAFHDESLAEARDVEAIQRWKKLAEIPSQKDGE